MVGYFIQGFLMGIAYLAPIGMQNLYVINSALRTNLSRAYQVALLVTLFDISLSLAAFWGTGMVLETVPLLKWGFYLMGSILILVIGIGLLRLPPASSLEVEMEESFYRTVVFTFSVTWLNPQALLDSTFLLGGYRASLDSVAGLCFFVGVVGASFVWFFGLVTLVVRFRSQLTAAILRRVNIVCGVTIIVFGLNLGYRFFHDAFGFSWESVLR
ncbi:putative membrane protein [Propionispora sp. 2/2-37]|uniref:LysE/ArgO family amino acid transporter n=1 Tax=Propionispora sp. 2/2-37 TaxID=1677858 RepID=UPI0006BB67A8|nr:LysE family transporter [Propionispora sp. 2/2-37]CUH95026.1 putative membrane protein [Propionispora sp. 2/2-37]